MRVIAQTEITSVEELASQFSNLLAEKGSSIWSIEVALDEDDECCGGAGGSESAVSDKELPDDEGGGGRGPAPRPLCRLAAVQGVQVRILATCQDLGCANTGGRCIPVLTQPPVIGCVCMRLQPGPGPRPPQPGPGPTPGPRG